jgi:hypothetical protein
MIINENGESGENVKAKWRRNRNGGWRNGENGEGGAGESTSGKPAAAAMALTAKTVSAVAGIANGMRRSGISVKA